MVEAIVRGGHPSWTLSIQIMPYADAKTYPINPFDLTKMRTRFARAAYQSPPMAWARAEPAAAAAPSNGLPDRLTAR